MKSILGNVKATSSRLDLMEGDDMVLSFPLHV